MHPVPRALLVLVAVCGCVPAFATETGQDVAAQPAAVPAAAPVATPATPPPSADPSAQSSQPAAAAAIKPDADQETARTRIPSGYRAKVVDGEKVFCRKETPLGSRFPTEVCMTMAQYEESVRQRDGLRQELTGKQKSYSISQ